MRKLLSKLAAAVMILAVVMNTAAWTPVYAEDVTEETPWEESIELPEEPIEPEEPAEPEDPTEPAEPPTVLCCAHVQKIGWQEAVESGGIAGTTGKSLRVEALKFVLSGADEESGIEYRSHVQSIGWEQIWNANGEITGTTGRGLRLEATKIRLTGPVAEQYDIYYCVHVKTLGWLAWTKNGETAGTAGSGLRIEALCIQILPKDSEAPENLGSRSVSYYPKFKLFYTSEIAGEDFQEYVQPSAVSGSTGRGLLIDAFRAVLGETAIYEDYGIEYRSHVQKRGWESVWSANGEPSGAPGEGLRIEALQMRLTGEMAKDYDLYYCVHMQKGGWLAWTKNGGTAGSTGLGLRIEAICMKLVLKGAEAPADLGSRALCSYGYASTSFIRSGVPYYIINTAYTEAALLVKDEEDQLCADHFNGIERQQFYFAKAGEELYSIRNAFSGQCLEVVNAGRSNGDKIRQNTWTGAAHQKWKVLLTLDGTIQVVNAASGKAMQMNRGETVYDSLVMIQNTRNTSALQKFMLKEHFTGGREIDGVWYMVRDDEILYECSNSPLVDYMMLVPYCDEGRNKEIKKITIHHTAGIMTAQQLGWWFQGGSSRASANYGIGVDGDIAMFVEEHDRSWCSGSYANDNEAITIEVSDDQWGYNDGTGWHTSQAALDALVALCTDICLRNNIPELIYTGDASGTLNKHLDVSSAGTSCPGEYLTSKLPWLAAEVNKRLAEARGGH